MASKLRVDSILPVDGAPTSGGGGIIQVVQTVSKEHEEQSGGGVSSFNDIPGMSVSITPKFSTSKILIRYAVNIGQNNHSGNGFIRVLKDGNTMSDFLDTEGTVANGDVFHRMGSQYEIGNYVVEFLDTAGGTSAITYKLQWSIESGRTVYLNRRGGSAEYGTVSTITVMEVSA